MNFWKLFRNIYRSIYNGSFSCKTGSIAIAMMQKKMNGKVNKERE